jgi:hypothetical protein
MEDVLEVYHRPYDPKRPVVCLDEVSKQLVGEARTPVPPAPGRPARVDYEYVRNGTASLFLLTEPLAGWRYVEVTERRTAVDFARILKFLAEEIHPEAKKIVLVLDNLNTHRLASLYQAFAPAEARRLAERFEVHYTPRHDSWLNVAEVEFSVLGRQCPGQRFADRASLEEAVCDWQVERNERGVSVDWQFRTKDARIRLKRLYPSIQN